MSQQLPVAPPKSRLVGHEHDQVFEMPTLLLGDHVVKRWWGPVGPLEPGFGDAHADEGVGGEDQGEPAQDSFDRVQTEVGQTEPLFEQEVVDFGLPTQGVAAQDGLRAQFARANADRW